jgi:hypothetical protein
MQTSILLSAVEARGGGEGTGRLNKEYELKVVWHKSISPILFREMEEAFKIGVICTSQFRGCISADQRGEDECVTHQPKSFKWSNN